MSLRIDVLAHFLVPGDVGGAEEFLVALVGGLVAEGAEVRVHTRRSATPLFWERPGRDGRLEVVARPDGGSRFVWETLEAARLDGRSDLILCPNYFVPPTALRTPTVAVIHDTNYARHPQAWGRAKRLWLAGAHRATLSSADAVVTISDFARRELIDVYGSGLGHRAEVIPNPIDWSVLGTPGAPEDDPPYFLTVGSHYPHKNLDTAAVAFARYVRSGGTARWKVVGQLPDRLRGHSRGYPDLGQILTREGIAGRVDVLGRVDPDVLARLLRRARALLFPSRYEGFGRPAVEALGLGVPVLCAKRTALPEVTLGHARFVEDPDDVEAWAQALRDIESGPQRVPDEVSSGVRGAYEARAVARRYIELFERVVA